MRTLVLFLSPLLVFGDVDTGRGHPLPGLKIRYFAQIDQGVYKGSRPKSDADFEFLRSLGIRYILAVRFLPLLDLREKRKAKRHGINVLFAPMNASIFSPTEEHVTRTLRILRNKQYQPIYFHCDTGRDRTGLIATLYELYYLGLPREQAMREMQRFGFRDFWIFRGLKNYLLKHERPPVD